MNTGTQQGLVKLINDFERAMTRPPAGPKFNFDDDDRPFVARNFLRSDNQSRLSPKIEDLCALAYGYRAAPMDVGTVGQGVDFTMSGNFSPILPLVRRADYGRLGGKYESRKFGDGNSIPGYDGLLTAEPLAEGEGVSAADVVATSALPLTAYTAGTKEISVTRRLVKQTDSIVSDLGRLALDTHTLNTQRVAMCGDNGTEVREPDGLENLITGTTATGGVFTVSTLATVQSTLKIAGADMKNLGAMVATDVFTFLLATPTVTGGASTFIRRSNISPTGFVLVASPEDDGIPLGVEPGMTGGSMILGDFSQSVVFLNETVDILVVKAYASDTTRIFTFLDYDFQCLHNSAFHLLSGIV